MIMDGNKRWSMLNNVSLKEGYVRGLYKIKEDCKTNLIKKRLFLLVQILKQ